MMHSRFILLLAAFLPLPITGCGTTPTEAQNAAKQLSAQIATYQTQQKNRVDQINKEYDDTFNQLMTSFTQLTRTQLQQSRDTDAQTIADQILSDDKQTLIGNFRNDFASTLKAERDKITAADTALAGARDAYTKSYTQAKLELSKLDALQSDLKLLAQNQNELAQVSHVIQVMIQNYSTLKQQAASATGASSAKSPAASPSKK